MKQNIQRFDSPEEYASFLEAIPAAKTVHDKHYGWKWIGGDMETGITKLREGDTTNLAAARELVDKLDLDALVANSTPTLVSSVAGFVPNVPSYIAGHPESMFARGYIEAPNIQAPLTVYVEPTVSSGVSHNELLQRGICILAFVLALEATRPVDLYVIQILGHSDVKGAFGPVVKIASRPMDLGRAVFMLTDVNYARRLAFAAVEQLSGVNSLGHKVPWAFGGPMESDYETKMREALGMQPDDVFVYGGHLLNHLMRTNPLEWVKQMVHKHATKE